MLGHGVRAARQRAAGGKPSFTVQTDPVGSPAPWSA
jgi:hypothetical protein